MMNNIFCKRYRSSKETDLIVTKNKFIIEIFQDDPEDKILSYIKKGIFNFGLDLFYGSVEQNLKIIELLRTCANKHSQFLGFTVPLSVYLQLSPRDHYTGRFKRNKEGVNLKLRQRVIVTTKRVYASASCHSFIYVNAKFLLGDIRRCDILRFGKYVQLQVLQVESDHLLCKVIVAGVVKPRMRVKFPSYIEDCHSSKTSAEELEDITFAMGVNLNVLMSHSPGTVEYCKELRKSMELLNFGPYYLFTRLSFLNLQNSKDAHWISESYDGFLIDCTDLVRCEDGIEKLWKIEKEFMDCVYLKKKPIFLKGCWSNLVDPVDYRYAFQYPDKYVLPCEMKFLRLFEAVFHKLSKQEIVPKKKVPLSTGVLLARSITASSLDFHAEAIVISSPNAEMALNIAHFRPRAVIISITNSINVANYSPMNHNVWMLPFDSRICENTLLSHQDETYVNLIYGLRYGLLKKLIDFADTVILVFCQDENCESTDKFAVIKIDNDYSETIRNVVTN